MGETVTLSALPADRRAAGCFSGPSYRAGPAFIIDHGQFSPHRVALCAEFPSLSWLAKTPEAALKGIQKVVADVVTDMQAGGDAR